MSTWNRMKQEIESIIPDDLIVARFWAALDEDYLSDGLPSGAIQVADDVTPLTVPRDVLVQVVEKTCTFGVLHAPFGPLLRGPRCSDKGLELSGD